MNNGSESKYQKRIITVPNILSFFRLCLIPVIIWLYVFTEDYTLTLAVLLLSGLTDVVDGFIARRFNMISDFGKAFDPIADKLTQIAMLFCLLSRFSYMAIPLVLLVIKEIVSGVVALFSIKKTGSVKGAVWHGKVTTVTLYSVMAIHLVWYNIPFAFSLFLVGLSIGVMTMSFIMYIIQYCSTIKKESANKQS